MEESHIPVLVLKTKTYDDVKRNLEVIGKVYGKEEAAKAKEDELDQAVHAVTDAVRAGNVIAILHVTPSSVSAELPSSIAGDMADLLHLKNIAADAAGDGQTTRIPYSMESLVQADPDVIFRVPYRPIRLKIASAKISGGNPARSHRPDGRQGGPCLCPAGKYFLLNPGWTAPRP